MAFKKIGALWLKDGKKGKFMTGNIELGEKEISVFVFKNDKGDNSRRPDYQIMIADDEQQPAAPEPPPKPTTGEPVYPDDNDTDIPF